MFDVVELERKYQGQPYCGPASGGKLAQADTAQKALGIALQMVTYEAKNLLCEAIVGFAVYDRDTKKCKYKVCGNRNG